MRRDLTAAEALEAVLDATPVLGTENAALREALGRILAEPVLAPRDLPPAANSAMDGYAVRRADLADASAERPVELTQVDEIPAGVTGRRTIGPGQTARILTGAPLPPGADAVVRQEDTARAGDQIAIRVHPAAREHVREAGEDVRAGERILEAGTRIGAAEIGMLASLARTSVRVHQLPRVAVLSGGDELVEPDGDLSGGKIVSSNSYSLLAQCAEIGVDGTYLGIAADSPEDVEGHLRAGLGADVLLSSGGVSVGDRDYVRGALEKLGCSLIFWGVRIKPGFPLAFGRFEGERPGLVFGLPGNPVSAMVTFEEFVRPALLKLSGHSRLHRPTCQARLGESLRKKPGRMHFVRVRLTRDGDGWIARSTGSQSSGVLRSMTQAHGLLIFPDEASELREGDTATVQLLDPACLASTTPGF